MGEVSEGGEGPYWILVPSKKKKKNRKEEEKKKKRIEAM
jgi:hypothetical protein